MWHLPFSLDNPFPLDIGHPLSTPNQRRWGLVSSFKNSCTTRTCAGSPPPRLVQPFYTSQQGRVEPRTAPPLCSALGRKVAGEGRGRGRSAGGSEETGDWLEWTRSRNHGARGGPSARTTGNGAVAGARNPGSPSARKPGSCSRAVERQGTEAERGAGRHGNGAGRPSARS